jgi:hypothetical protein
MKNPKSLSGFELTAVRGKWFAVNDLNHTATGSLSLPPRKVTTKLYLSKFKNRNCIS